MISDEVRELLSAYVDGELRDADAARFEEMAKGDALLRREIEAYRTLSRELKALEEAEQPSPRMRERVFARVHAHEAAAAPRPRFAWRPLAAAAALLIAAGGGLLFGRQASPAAVRLGPEREIAIRMADPAPIPVFPPIVVAESAEVASARERAQAADAVIPAGALALLDERARGSWREGEFLSDRAWQFTLMQRELEERTERARREAGEETRTGAARNVEIAMMLSGFDAVAASEELVLFRAREGGEKPASLPPLPAGVKVGMDAHVDASRVSVSSGEPALLLAGEVLVAADKSGRTRVIAADSYVLHDQIVPVLWADAIEVPANRQNLALQESMLGPRARQRLTGREGRDPEFAAWLDGQLGGRRLADALHDGGRTKDADALRRAISADRGAIGFAVYSQGRLLGVELFGSHGMLEEFAPRLLPGYLRDAGRSIEVRPVDAGAPVAELARRLLEDVPNAAVRVEVVERGTREGWPEGVRCVNLRGAGGAPLGHGLLAGSRPIHLTLFGE